MHKISKHLLTKTALLALISFASVLTFAIQVGQEVELTKYVNGRAPNADFRRSANNVIGVLATGTNGRVMEVRRFRSGNSGVLLNISEGPLRGRRLWVYFVPSDPSLRLFTPQGNPTPDPVNAGSGVTVRPVPAQPDPSTDRPPVQPPAPVPAPPVPAPLPPVPVPAPPRPPIPSPAAIPDIINNANNAVGGTNVGGQAGCRDCAGTTVNSPAVSPQPAAPASQTSYFSNTESFSNRYASESGQRLAAHRFLALRAHLNNFSIQCRDFYPNLMRAYELQRENLAPLYRRYNPIMGGLNQLDTIQTSYANLASQKFSDFRNTASARQICDEGKRDFDILVSLGENDITRFLSLPAAQRATYLADRRRR